MYTYTLHTRFCTFGANLYAQSVLTNINFCTVAQSEVYYECVVGWEGRGEGDL